MQRESVLVIGGGVIGVCAAYYLAERGWPVHLVEQDDIAAGSSHGNAGLIVPSHIIPLPHPGVLTRGLKWLLDPESPLYIKPRLNLGLLAWLLRFGAACRESRVQKAIPVLRDMGRASSELYEQLAVLDGLDCGYQRTGLLTIFRNQRSFEDGIKEANVQAAHGVTAKVLDGAAVRQMEPTVRPEVVGGVFLPGDAHFTPDMFVRGLARLAERHGLMIHPATEVLGFEVSHRKVTTVRTTRGDFRPDQVVVAAGAWSPRLVRGLRLSLPIQPAKGHSVTVKRPALSPTIPLALGESRVIVTPMTGPSGPVLRFAGTLELAGFDFSINRRRVNALTRAARTYLIGMEELETLEIWRGLRPCTPDDLPILGRPPGLDNVILATGHGMLGMSLGPITGKLVSQIACGEKPDVDLKPLRVERF